MNYSVEKNPRLVWLAHNFAKYDGLVTMRGILDYGMQEKITYIGHNDQVHTRPLLAGVPKVLFRSENEIISIDLRFSCPYDAGLCTCKMSKEEKEHEKAAGRILRPCPFKRRILMADSYLFLSFSLDKIIHEVNNAQIKENLSRETAFPCTMNFLHSQNFTEDQIALVLKKKISIPYEHLTSFESLTQTTMPTPEQFKSILRGTESLKPQEYEDFEEIWKKLAIPDLFTLLRLYVQLDSCQTADGVAYFYSKLFKACHLHPLHYLTISSFSLASVCLNSRNPDHAKKKLFLPILPGNIHDQFFDRLIGGYATSQSIFAKFNHGRVTVPMSKDEINQAKVEKRMIIPRDLTQNHKITSAIFKDMNSLYAGAMQSLCPYDRFQLMEKFDKSIKFAYISKQILDLNVGFFHDKITQEKISYLIRVRVTYDLNSAVTHSLDIGPFPILKTCSASELSNDQQASLQANRRLVGIEPEPPKLVSVHQDDTEVNDFVVSVLYMATHHSLIITSVESIVEFRVRDIFTPYMVFLQKCRQESMTTIESKLFKNLG